MKRLILTAALTLAALLGNNAYADGAEYNDGTVTAPGYDNVKTVLILRDTGKEPVDDDIYYVGQEDSEQGLDAVVGFAVKENPLPGTYKMLLGVGDITKTIEFTIGNEAPPTEFELDPLADSVSDNEDEGTFNMGFVTSDSGVSLSGCKSLVIVFKDEEKISTVRYPIIELGINPEHIIGNVVLGLVINNIPNNYKDGVSVSFSGKDPIIPDLSIESDEVSEQN